MMFQKHLTGRNWFIGVLILLLLSDVLILMKIPFLQQAVTFVFYTFLPGCLILQVLKLHRTRFLKKVVLSVGLSLSLLLFMGIFLNTLHPYLSEPLAPLPVLVALNIMVLILVSAAYWRNRQDDDLGNPLYLEIQIKDKLVTPLIIPFLFPLLAILGTYMMNISQNNILILLLLFLIPLYLLLMVIFREKIHPVTYPLAVWLISLSLLLLHGLTSQHLMGRDVHSEFYCFQLTLTDFHWNLGDYYNPYNACLSVTILPTMYQVLSALNPEYIFKLFMALIGSFIPLVVYQVARNYLGDKYAFFASLLFVFQLFFVYLLGAVRQEIAMLFFFLTVLVLFDKQIKGYGAKILIILFIVSTLVSHYSTAYVAFLLILPILLLPFLSNLLRKRKLVFTNFDIIFISLAFIIIWYLLVAKVQFVSGAAVVTKTVAATAAGGVGGSTSFTASRGAYVLGILGIVLKSVPNTISVIVHDLIFATILVGLAEIGWRYRYWMNKLSLEFIIGIIISIALLVMFIVLPYISIAYDAARLFFQLIIFLAPVFIIGCIRIAKLIRKPKWDVYLMLVLLISLFCCATYLQYYFLDTPYSPIYEKDGKIRAESYIYNSELESARWLYDKGLNLSIYSDGREGSRFLLAYGPNMGNRDINGSFFGWNKTIDRGYIYLGYLNVNQAAVLDIDSDIVMVDMGPYIHLFNGKMRIYDNGGSQVWW